MKLISCRMFLFLERHAPRVRKVRNLATRAGASPKSKEDGFVDAFLMAEPTSPHFLRVDISEMDVEAEEAGGKPEPAIVFDLEFATKPQTSPPRRVLQNRKKGLTADWFLGEVNRLVGTEETLVVASAMLEAPPSWSPPPSFPVARRRQACVSQGLSTEPSKEQNQAGY